jgi:hypothetical protein
MATSRKQNGWERRLREIEREKERVRGQMDEVRRWADSIPDAEQMLQEPRFRGTAASPGRQTAAAAGTYGAGVGGAGVLEMESPDAPDHETSLDFEPGPDGLDTKRVVMPRLQRTDLLRPAIGGSASASRLVEPEHDRFRSYFGSAGLKRVREARREQGTHRLRAIFMILMVLTLGFILFKMVT